MHMKRGGGSVTHSEECAILPFHIHEPSCIIQYSLVADISYSYIVYTIVIYYIQYKLLLRKCICVCHTVVLLMV